MSIESIGLIGVNELVKAGVKAIVTRATDHGKAISIDTSRMAAAIQRHQDDLVQWSEKISFKDLAQSKSMTKVYVDLNLEVVRSDEPVPRRLKRQGTFVADLLRSESHKVLLGEAGAGKTTSLKKLVREVLPTQQVPARDYLPLLITVRDLKRGEGLVSKILAGMGVAVVSEKDIDKTFAEEFRLSSVAGLIDAMRLLVLVDGLDELSPTAQDSVVGHLRYLCRGTRRGTIIVTCRTAAFAYHIDNTSVYSLQALTHAQIGQVARRWLGPPKGRAFVAAIARTPYAGAQVRPLTLAHLLAIYERTGSIPRRPKTVYRKIVRLFLTEWDEQRGVKRLSDYGAFEADVKEEFLQALAYHLRLANVRGRFTRDQFSQAYSLIREHFQLPVTQWNKVADEVCSHTGLLVQSGFEAYEFAHLSLQEYLTAAFLLGKPTSPASVIWKLPDECAILVALSSDPTAHLTNIIISALSAPVETTRRWTPRFFARLCSERVEGLPRSDVAWWFLLLLDHCHSYDDSGPTAWSSRIRLDEEPAMDVTPDGNRAETFITLLQASPHLEAKTRDILGTAESCKDIGGDAVSVRFSDGNLKRAPDRVRTHLARAKQQLFLDLPICKHLADG